MISKGSPAAEEREHCGKRNGVIGDIDMYDMILIQNSRASPAMPTSEDESNLFRSESSVVYAC